MATAKKKTPRKKAAKKKSRSTQGHDEAHGEAEGPPPRPRGPRSRATRACPPRAP